MTPIYVINLASMPFTGIFLKYSALEPSQGCVLVRPIQEIGL